MSTTVRRRIQAITALTAVFALGIIGLSGPAWAAPTIDPTKDGTIHLTKFEGDVQTPGDGKNGPTEAPGLSVLDADTAGFALFPIVNGPSTTTSAGQEAAYNLSKEWAAAGLTTKDKVSAWLTGKGMSLGSPIGGDPVMTTDGEITWSGLDLGLYVLIETKVPEGHTGSAPAVIALPITDPDDNSNWLMTENGSEYLVNVFPKNSILEVDKTVQDAKATHVGDILTYTIVADIPTSPTDDPKLALDAYQMLDVLDGALEYVPDSMTVGVITADDFDADGTPVNVPASDWTLLAPDDVVTLPDDSTSQNALQLNITGNGLETLGEFRGGKIVITFKVTVATLPTSPDGFISNEALIFPNKPSIDSNEPTGSSEPVISKFGGITVTKTAADLPDDDPEYFQVGAEFEVWLDVNHNGMLDEGTDTKILGPVATDADGQVTFDGLRYSAWWDGAEHSPLGGIAIATPTNKWTDPGTGGSATDQDVWASYNSYLLVETKAVDGYELLAEPYPFIVSDLAATDGVDIEDNPIDLGFKLPFTGGTGSTIVGIAGLVLLVGAAGVSVVVLRRRSLTPHR